MHIYIYICMSYVLKDVYTSTSTDIDTNIIPKRHCLVHSLNIMPLSRDPTFPIELADASSFETHVLWRKGNQLHPMYVCKSSCIRILVLLSFEKKQHIIYSGSHDLNSYDRLSFHHSQATLQPQIHRPETLAEVPKSSCQLLRWLMKSTLIRLSKGFSPNIPKREFTKIGKRWDHTTKKKLWNVKQSTITHDSISAWIQIQMIRCLAQSSTASVSSFLNQKHKDARSWTSKWWQFFRAMELSCRCFGVSKNLINHWCLVMVSLSVENILAKFDHILQFGG